MTKSRKPRQSRTLYGANNRIVILSNQIDRLKEIAEDWERKFNESVDMHADDCTQHERVTNGLRKDLAGTERALHEMTTQRDHLLIEVKALRDRINDLECVCDEKDKNIDTYRGHFETAQKNYMMLESGTIALIKRIS